MFAMIGGMVCLYGEGHLKFFMSEERRMQCRSSSESPVFSQQHPSL